MSIYKNHITKSFSFAKSSFALCLLFVLFTSCEQKFQPPMTGISSAEIPDYESWNSEVEFSDSGFVKAVLRAGYIAYYSDLGYTLIDSGAEVDFYKDGKIVSTLTGKHGKVFDATKDIEILDSVIVTNTEGSILKTQKLYWTEATQRVSSDEFVSIKTPGEEIQGIGFESDQNLKNYRIFKVTGTFSN